MEFLRQFAVPGEGSEVKAAIDNFPERMALPPQVHGALNALRVKMVYDKTASLGILGLDSKGDFFYSQNSNFRRGNKR